MPGVPLLPGILSANARIIVEIAFGANLNADASNWESGVSQWIDVTTDVIQDQPITISPMGRSDRFSQAQPAGCTLRLNNSSGAYSRGPASSNWPYVRPNTPLRVTVTLNGITLYRRFFGYIESWEPHEDDASTKSPWVAVTAWGKTHMLDIGTRRVLSPVTRAILGDASTYGLYQYWPCEDDTSATQSGSAVGGVPLQYDGQPVVAGLNVNTVPSAAGSGSWQDAGLPPQGTLPLPRLDNGARMLASFPPGNATAWTVQFAAWTSRDEYSDTPTLDRTFAEWTTPGGTYVDWKVIADYNDPTFGFVVKVVATKPNGSTSQVEIDGILASRLVEYRVSASQAGSNISVSINMHGAVYGASGTFTSATLTGVASFIANPLSQVTADFFAVGQVRIWNTSTAPHYQMLAPTFGSPVAWYSYWSEDPVTRISRLCAQEGGLGIPIVSTGTSNINMGAQSTGKLIDLLRECEAADQGVLYDGVSQGLAYISRSAKYNQSAALTLDASSGQVAPPFEPKDQDPQRRNYWTVSRNGGTTVVATDTSGPLGTGNIGTLDQLVSGLNLATDTLLPHVAGWLLRLGTVNEPYYYPTLHLDLSAIPSLAANWLTTAIGNRIDVTNLSTVSSRNPPGTVSLILEGYTEIISPYMWIVTANLSQAPPWQVAATGSTFRLEMAGQTLAGPLAAGATSLSLATAPNHQPFTTNGADFPVDLYVNGWPVHVTACGNTLTDTASRTVSNGLGTADSGQVYTASGGNASDYSVGSGVISLSLGTVAFSRKGLLPALPSGDFEAFATVVCPVTASGGNISVGIIGHEFSATDYYMLGVQFTTAGTLLAWWTRIGGAGGGIVTQNAATGLSYSPGTPVNIHIKYSGSTHTANVWTTGPEPNGWQLTVTATDATLDPVKAIGIRAILETGNTNTLPVVITFDNITIPNPQVLTCSASPNTSTVPAGTAVTLWRPAALAL
jgi:hypothetical protein